MASHPHDFGRASALPLSAVLASIPSYPRPVIERLVGRMIEHLDEQDGDSDLEDATNAEDEGLTWLAGRYSSMNGAGCPVSDPGECSGDPEMEQGRVAIYGLNQSRGPIRFARVSDFEQPHKRRLPWSDFNLSG